MYRRRFRAHLRFSRDSRPGQVAFIATRMRRCTGFIAVAHVGIGARTITLIA